jgi:DNA repair protein RecO (recombination protein O)
MQNRRYSTEGIVLGQTNYGEADRIVMLITKDYGKVRVICKGIRKLKSRKRGHIDVFNRLKFSVSKSSAMDIVTEAELIEAHSDLKTDLAKVTVAYYLVEIIAKLTQLEEKQEMLYYFLAEKLHELELSHSLKTFRLNAAKELLQKIGFWPYGQELLDPDRVIEEVIERKLSSTRVGKKLVI